MTLTRQIRRDIFTTQICHVCIVYSITMIVILQAVHILDKFSLFTLMINVTNAVDKQD